MSDCGYRPVSHIAARRLTGRDAFEDRIIASRSFEEVVPALSDAPRDVVEAFDEALGDTMRDSVEWSIREIKRYAG